MRIALIVALALIAGTPAIASGSASSSFDVAHRSDYCDSAKAIGSDVMRRGWKYVRDEDIAGGTRVHWSRGRLSLVIDYNDEGTRGCVIAKFREVRH